MRFPSLQTISALTYPCQDFGLGRKGKGQGRPGTHRKGLSCYRHQGSVPPRRQAVALPRPQAHSPPPGGQHLPAQWAGQVPQVQACPQRPGREERPVLLLRLPVPDQAGQRGLRFPQAQRPPLRGIGGGKDSLQHPHRGQHHRAGQGGGRGDGRRCRRAAQAAGDHRRGAGGCQEETGPRLALHRE